MLTNRFASRLRRVALLLTIVFSFSLRSLSQVWTVIAIDVKGDGHDPSLADAAQLSYRYDKQQDFLWFRVTLYGVPDANAFGVNIAVDTGADESSKTNWWRQNASFRFDRLLTAWVTRTPCGYHGTIGVSDAAGAKAGNMNNLLQDNLRISVEGDSIVVGVKRTELTDKMAMKVMAAVGSNEQWNDDIPDSGFATIDLSAPRSARLREIDVSRDNLRFPAGYHTLRESRAPALEVKGRGTVPLILIPGVYSGSNVFDSFIARNQTRYKFYVVTPPGLNGTAPRPLPPETDSIGKFAWTRQLERDILRLVEKEHLQRPAIIAHGFPGSLAANDLAAQYPEKFRAVVQVASMPVQFSPSPSDPTRRTMATPSERIAIVNGAWLQKWFKYVTPETWVSNNYSAEMYANDPGQAQRARQQAEAAPLEVKIRYLTEFMASDQRDQLLHLTIPLLALRPGFNETVLANPASAWYKGSFVDAWEGFSTNAAIRLVIVRDARALLLDDQPMSADEAIEAFLDSVKSR